MGRSSGGGGSHSSGGFSGGGRSSGGFSSGRYSSSYGSSRPSGHIYHHHYHSGPGYYGGYYGGYGPRYTSFKSVWIVLIIIILMTVIPSIIDSLPAKTAKVPKNKTERTALNGVVLKTDWCEDNIGWITSKDTLISGLEDFYKKTGIQPYILFVPYSVEFWNGNNINVEKVNEYMEKIYSEKFKDEGHFIFAYFQCRNDSKSEMDGEFRYLSGYSADTIMDDEAISILWGYFQKNYYNTSLSIEKMISNTFSETAKSIMNKTKNVWDFIMIAIIIIIVILIILFIYMTVKSRKQIEQQIQTQKEENIESNGEKQKNTRQNA